MTILLLLRLFAEVQFTDQPGPATLAIGCLGRQVDLICCTANFARISWQWRVDDATWQDFMTADADYRYCLRCVHVQCRSIYRRSRQLVL